MTQKKTLASTDVNGSEKSKTTQVKQQAHLPAILIRRPSCTFSLDDVASTVAQKKVSEPKKKLKKTVSKTTETAKSAQKIDTIPVEKRVHVAASLSDILGFNPAAKESSVSLEADEIPQNGNTTTIY